jgi:hypothetical protein
MKRKSKPKAARPSTVKPIPPARHFSWLQRVQGLKSYPPHPEPKPVPENIYDTWQGLVPEYARGKASMSFDQILAIAKTIPQHLKDDEAAEFGTPRVEPVKPEPAPAPSTKKAAAPKKQAKKRGRPIHSDNRDSVIRARRLRKQDWKWERIGSELKIDPEIIRARVRADDKRKAKRKAKAKPPLAFIVPPKVSS